MDFSPVLRVFIANIERFPIPATLIDASGIIVALNQAFLEYAAQLKIPIRREDRIGRHILDFARHHLKQGFARLLEQLWREGSFSHLWTPDPDDPHPSYTHIWGTALQDETGQVAGALILRQDLSPEYHRREALESIRQKPWAMKGDVDFPVFLEALRREMTRIVPALHACSVTILEPEQGRGLSYQMGAQNKYSAYSLRDLSPAIQRAWESQQPLYRPDLRAEDLYGEAPSLERGYSAPVRCVLDVPFPQGTLGLNSLVPRAFSKEDIEFAGQVAVELSRGLLRLEDLRRLEEQIQALEKEVAVRRQVEADARQSSDRLNLLLDHTAGIVFELDPQGHWTLSRGRDLEKLGRMPDEVVGASIFDYYRDQPLILETVRQALAGVPQEIEVAYAGRVWLARYMPMRGTAGLVERVFGIAIDITGRKRAEKYLQTDLALQQMRNAILQMESEDDWKKVLVVFEKQLRGLVSFEACSISLVDLERERSTVYYLNNIQPAEFTRLTRVPPAFQEALASGRPVYRRNAGEIAQWQDEALLEMGINSVVDMPFLGGTLAINSLQEDAFGAEDFEVLEQFASVLSEAHRRLLDLQAIKAREEQLLHSQRLESVGHLAAGIAHDFNNILTVIMGTAQLLRRGNTLSPEDQEALALISTQGDRAAQLIRQILDFSRRTTILYAPLDLAPLLREGVKLLRRTLPESIQVTEYLEKGPFWIRSNPTQLQQVLANLAVNARDAMPGGGRLDIRLSSRHWAVREQLPFSTMEPGRWIVWTLADTGTGIPPEIKEHIFDPFFTTKNPGQGTGLGLAQVYGIVKQHGGYIQVQSAVGKGTSFAIYLPALAEMGIPSALSEKPSARGKGQKVLVVEDEEAVRKVVAALLQALNYQAIPARGAREALGLLERREAEISLVLTDFVMPGLSGQEFIRQLQEHYPHLPVVVMSGYATGPGGLATLPEGIAGFVEKPVNGDYLGRVLHQVLDSLPEPGAAS